MQQVQPARRSAPKLDVDFLSQPQEQLELHASDQSHESAEDDSDRHHHEAEASRHYPIGPSISRLQTRLKSPTTPAAEKAAALDGSPRGFFDGEFPVVDEPAQLEDEPAQIEEEDSPPRAARRDARRPLPRASSGEAVPSSQATLVDGPSNSSPHISQAPAAHREQLKTFLSPPGSPRSRQRSSSATSALKQETRPRKSTFSIPTPKISFPSVQSAKSWLLGQRHGEHDKPVSRVVAGVAEPADGASSTTAASTTTLYTIQATTASSSAVSVHDHANDAVPATSTLQQPSEAAGSPARMQHHPTRPELLKRSTSDGSLHLARAMSHASSLGDDSRWKDVSEQTNSRMKAIRDTLADSSFKMPRISTFTSLNLSSLSLEFGSSRKSSDALSQPQPANRRPNGRSMAKIAPSLEPTAPIRNSSPANESRKLEKHPQFAKALEHLTGDLVILGGYRGSILRSAVPPNRQLWVPIKVGLNLRKVNLEVGLEEDADERATETVIPSGMLKHIGPVEITRRLFKRLRATENCVNGSLRVWDYGYDWRLSPHFLSQQLVEFLQKLPCNQADTPVEQRGATVIAHSLGGLLTRHAVNTHPHLFSGVLYAGTPQTCVNILGPLRNGDDVLLSSKVLTAQVNFTMKTSFALLPLDGKCFVDSQTGEEYDVDFFDPETWTEYRLSPCIARPLPPEEPQPSLKESLVGSMANVLPMVTGRGNLHTKKAGHKTGSSSTGANNSNGVSSTNGSSQTQPQAAIDSGDVRAAVGRKVEQALQENKTEPITAHMNHNENPEKAGEDPETSIATAVSIPRDEAVKYLQRILPEVRRFKEELAFDAAIDARGGYPPTAVIYGKSVPTVVQARVKGRDGIKHADAYDDLAFASGDGVVLAKASQLPPGYKAARGGVVSSDRGHIALLADLEAVGRCLNAIRAGRARKIRHAREHG